MKRRIGVVVVACILVAAVTLPAAAAARSQTVWAGGPLSFQKLMQNKYGAEANDFFPHTLTVNQGDIVQWQGMSVNFHSIDIPRAGGKDLPLITPTGKIASGFNDFSGSPFWFNGKVPLLGFNPSLFAPLGGNRYNGSARVDSGLPLGKPAPFSVKFLKPGTYEYFCDVHYDMHGIIVVRAKRKAVPTPAQNAATVATQAAKDVKVAKALDMAKPSGAKVSLGEAGKYNVEVLAMFPSKLTVNKGTTVSFSMSPLTGETHTATFGPLSYLKPISQTFDGPPPIDPRGVNPSSPPGPPIVFPGAASHGNGFVNTGILDKDAATPLPPGAKITFTAAGTYQFVCLIHPFMHGTIVVK